MPKDSGHSKSDLCAYPHCLEHHLKFEPMKNGHSGQNMKVAHNFFVSGSMSPLAQSQFCFPTQKPRATTQLLSSA
eukprot:6485301-Amphidinium_carterae.1